MASLAERVQQLELEKLGLQFQVALLCQKLNITGEDMADFAEFSLAEFKDEDKDSDMALYLTGMIKGIRQNTEEADSLN